MKTFWPFAFSFLLFASIAAVMPFMVLYYQNLGLTGAQISILTSIPPLISMVSTPLWTGLADATSRHRLLMGAAILLSAATRVLFPLLQTFTTVLLVTVLASAVFAPVPSFGDSAAMSMLAEQKEKYGRVRLGGTIGFGITASIVGALVEHHGLRAAFWTGAVMLMLGFLVSQRLTYGQPGASDASIRKNAHTLLKDSRWVPFLGLAFTGGLAYAITNNYLFSYMKELRANESIMGLTLSVGTLSEIPVLFFGHHLLKRLKPYGLLILAIAVTGIRSLLFAASHVPGLILGAQLLLNGLAYPAMWIAGVSYADAHAPPGLRVTAQGIFSAMVVGVGAATGGFLGGQLLGIVHGRGLFAISGAISCVAACAALVLRRRP